MTDFQVDGSLYTIDTARNNGLKTTSLSVLGQKKHHKTQIQKQFQQFSQQQRHTQQHQQQHQQLPPQQFQPPHPHAHAQPYSLNSGSVPYFPSSYRKSSRLPSMTPSFSSQAVQFQQQYQNKYQGSMESLAPPQLTHSHPPAWTERYRENSENSLGNYSPSSSSEFTSEDTKLTSPQTSQSEWRQEEQENEELLALREELQRLKNVERENLALKQENEKLRFELEVQIKEEPEEEEKELDPEQQDLKAQNEELKKSLAAYEEMEMKLTDITQQLNKFKLVHKTTLDQKNREITKLKDEVASLEKESESFFTDATDVTADETSQVVKQVPTTPSIAQSKTMASHEKELVDSLLDTIRSMKMRIDVLEEDKRRLVNLAQKEKKMVKALAHSSRHKVQIRRGLNLLAEVDTLI